MAAGNTFTNHPGVVDFKGRSYFFFHNSALPGGSDFRRSVCVEEFTYGADGSIPKITMTTTGPTAVATLNPFQQVEAETIAFSSGLKTETCTDTGAGMAVTSISNGDYIKVKDVDFLDGVTSFDARVSAANSNAKIELHLDSRTGTSLGTCGVSGASSWTTKTCAVSGGSGKHDLYLKFTGGSGELFKFNWWKFTGPTMPSGAGDGGAGDGGAGGNSGTGSDAGSGPLAGTGGRAGGAGGRTEDAGNVASGGSTGGTGGGATSSSSGSASGGQVGPSASESGSCSCQLGASHADHGGSAARSATRSTALWLVVPALLLLRRRERGAK
jgi:hypothetical protein